MGFVLKGDRETGTITYHCSTTKRAVDKLQDFRRAEYRNIIIVTEDKDCISESKLFHLAKAAVNVHALS